MPYASSKAPDLTTQASLSTCCSHVHKAPIMMIGGFVGV